MMTAKASRAARRRLGEHVPVDHAFAASTPLTQMSLADACMVLLLRHGPLSSRHLAKRLIAVGWRTRNRRSLREMCYCALYRAQKRGEVEHEIREDSDEINGWREAVWRLNR